MPTRDPPGEAHFHLSSLSVSGRHSSDRSPAQNLRRRGPRLSARSLLRPGPTGHLMAPLLGQTCSPGGLPACPSHTHVLTLTRGCPRSRMPVAAHTPPTLSHGPARSRPGVPPTGRRRLEGLRLHSSVRTPFHASRGQETAASPRPQPMVCSVRNQQIQGGQAGDHGNPRVCGLGSPGMVRSGRRGAGMACRRRVGVTEAPESTEGSRVWSDCLPRLVLLGVMVPIPEMALGPLGVTRDQGRSAA